MLGAATALLTILLIGWGPELREPGMGWQLTSTQAGRLSLDTVPSIPAPIVQLTDGASGRVLAARSPSTRHAIGSITKLMTAMLAVNRLKLNRVVTVSSKAASEPGSTMWLVAGDRLSVRALLYGMLIPSGNDAAEELAQTMMGTDSRFAALMNRQAKAYRLRCSHYVTAFGLDAPHQYSCARDVTTMARFVLGNRLLARIVGTRHAVVHGAQKGRTFDLVTTNLLLNWYRGAIGVKTGTTDQAGGCVVAAARRGGHVILAVVLGAGDYDRFQDAARLLDFAFHDYVWPGSDWNRWSTASLIRRIRVRPGPIPGWEAPWLTIGRRGLVSAPFDPR